MVASLQSSMVREKITGFSRTILTAFLILVIFMSSGCSNKPPKTIPVSQANLKDIIAAIALQPNVRDLKTYDYTYIALVRRNGSYSLIRTYGMGTPELLWTKHGLYFADRKDDYFIPSHGGNGISTANPKTEVANQIIEQENGKPLAIFDEGFGKDTVNHLQILDYTAKKHEVYRITQQPFKTLTICNTGIYGLSQETLVLNKKTTTHYEEDFKTV